MSHYCQQGKLSHDMISTKNKCFKQGISLKSTNYKIYHSPRLAAMTTLALKFCQCPALPLTYFTRLLIGYKLQRPLFQLSLWSPEHMAYYNFPLLIIIPGIHNLACLHDDNITHSTNKTLLNFVEIYFPIPCFTISILSMYFHVHILCALYKKLINLEIIYVNH